MIPAMIVDDEKLTLEDLSTLINWEKYGFTIVAKTFNGKQGLKKYQETHPQLILTDIRMPFMDGIQMSEEIRKMDQEVQIVLLTAYEEFEYAKAAIRLGVTEYLIKSEITDISLSAFLEKMRVRIQQRNREKEFLAGDVADKYIHADVSAKMITDIPHKRKTEFSKPIESAVAYIRRNYSDPDLSLTEIAAYVHLSEGYLSTNFKRETGITVKNYLTDVRIDAAKKMIDSGNYHIYEVAEATGYRSSQYFSQAFQKKTGIFAKDYRKGES